MNSNSTHSQPRVTAGSHWSNSEPPWAGVPPGSSSGGHHGPLGGGNDWSSMAGPPVGAAQLPPTMGGMPAMGNAFSAQMGSVPAAAMAVTPVIE